MKTRFNIYDVADVTEEVTSLDDLITAGCTNVRVIAADREARTIRVECDLPDDITSPRQLALGYATLEESQPRRDL